MSKWIDVKERLPKDERTLLLYGKLRDCLDVYRGWFSPAEDKWYTLFSVTMDSVTHWRHERHKVRPPRKEVSA